MNQWIINNGWNVSTTPHNKPAKYLGIVAVTFATATISLTTTSTIVVAIKDKTTNFVRHILKSTHMGERVKLKWQDQMVVWVFFKMVRVFFRIVRIAEEEISKFVCLLQVKSHEFFISQNSAMKSFCDVIVLWCYSGRIFFSNLS